MFYRLIWKSKLQECEIKIQSLMPQLSRRVTASLGLTGALEFALKMFSVFALFSGTLQPFSAHCSCLKQEGFPSKSQS